MNDHPEYAKLIRLYEQAMRRCKRARTRKKRRHAAHYGNKLGQRIRAYESQHALPNINFMYCMADYECAFLVDPSAYNIVGIHTHRISPS